MRMISVRVFKPPQISLKKLRLLPVSSSWRYNPSPLLQEGILPLNASPLLARRILILALGHETVYLSLLVRALVLPHLPIAALLLSLQVFLVLPMVGRSEIVRRVIPPIFRQ